MRIAGRFFDRSTDTTIFQRGMNAHNKPGFYQQLAYDKPDAGAVPTSNNG